MKDTELPITRRVLFEKANNEFYNITDLFDSKSFKKFLLTKVDRSIIGYQNGLLLNGLPKDPFLYQMVTGNSKIQSYVEEFSKIVESGNN